MLSRQAVWKPHDARSTRAQAMSKERIAETYASEYIPSYLEADERADLEAMCYDLADQGKFQRYELTPYGNFLAAGPKIEYYICNERGERARYGWGQTPRFWQAGYPMDDQLIRLVERIEQDYKERVNQCAPSAVRIHPTKHPPPL
jgi:hypothetical protein